jgi:phosphinothricin acetyltransferase
MMPSMAPATVVVRAATDDDAAGIDAIYDHYVAASAATFDVEPMGLDRRRAWLRERSGGRHRVLVALEHDRPIGFASSGPYRSRPAYDTSVMLSAYVDPRHTGRGIGTALYGELIEDLQRLDIHRAVAGITLPNPGSVALHRRFGFTHIGTFTEQGRKFGRYWDVAWFERPMPYPAGVRPLSRDREVPVDAPGLHVRKGLG